MNRFPTVNQGQLSTRWDMVVTTVPGQPRMDKSFTIRVHLLDPAGAPVTGAKVAGTLSMKEMNHGNSHFDFTEKGRGVYEGISKVEMSGEWNLKLSAEHGADRLEGRMFR